MLDIFAAFGKVSEMTSLGMFFLFFFGTFISEDATCLLAGASVAAEQTSFGFAMGVCLAGIFAGDMLLYGIGRFVGAPIFQLKPIRRLVSETSLDRSQKWLSKNAATAVFVSRFVSGLRLPTYLAAGAMKADFIHFTICFFLAAAIWTPLLVGIAAFSVSFMSRGTVVAILIGVFVIFRLIIKYANWKNRRLAIGRVKRILKWEFWPLAVFYFPIISYVLYLGLRHRSFTLFTAANPGIPAGGFVGESKDEIYASLMPSNEAASYTLHYVKLCASDQLTKRLLSTAKFKVTNQLNFPLVLKPDRGERGKGVTIIYDRKQLAKVIAAADKDLILQEYSGGVEASIFYYRFPDDDNGHIFSITEKVFPSVTGDGFSTLEKLILNDPRAVCMAAKYFQYLADSLDNIPAKGKLVQLIDIGTHSRGAIFQDGAWIKTAALEKRIDEICYGIYGFFFGRFDIRAASFDDLRQGRNFKIIELNGVTSESTNFYDRRFTLVDAYRILFRQWRLAFHIGKMNRDRGYKPLTIWQLLRLVITKDASQIMPATGAKIVHINSTKACA